MTSIEPVLEHGETILRTSIALCQRSALLWAAASTATDTARESRRAKADLRRASPFLRTLSLRGGSDGPETELPDISGAMCGICRKGIRIGDSLIYRRNVPVHFDCAYPPAHPEDGGAARRARLITIVPLKDRAGRVVAWDHRCGKCGSTWRDSSMRGHCPSCGPSATGFPASA